MVTEAHVTLIRGAPAKPPRLLPPHDVEEAAVHPSADLRAAVTAPHNGHVCPAEATRPHGGLFRGRPRKDIPFQVAHQWKNVLLELLETAFLAT